MLTVAAQNLQPKPPPGGGDISLKLGEGDISPHGEGDISLKLGE